MAADYNKILGQYSQENMRYFKEDETGECELSHAELKSMMNLGLIHIKQRKYDDPEIGYIDYVLADGYKVKDVNKAITKLKKEDI